LHEGIGLMFAEDLLGANQPGEAGGGVVDGGGELEMFPSTALRTGPSTALRACEIIRCTGKFQPITGLSAPIAP